MSTSPWSANPNAWVNAPLPCTSGSQVPVPSSLNLATYRVPESNGLLPSARICRHGLAETYL